MSKEWIPLIQEAPIAGHDVSKPENLLGHENIPEGQNFLIEEGYVAKRSGYSVLQAGLPAILSTGRVMEAVEYGDANGALHFVVASTTKIVEDVSGTWTDRTGTALTATSDDAVFMSPVGGASLDNLYITNGVDNVRVWTGSGNTADLTTTGFTTFKSKCLLGFKGHLLHGNVTEDGSVYPYRLRFSAANDPTQYDPVANVTTGFRNLIEDKTNSKIQTMLPIKEAIAVYKEHAIVILNYEGSSNLFIPYQRVPDRGAISPKAVCPVLDGNTHMVVSNDNIFLFDGFNFQVPPIGDRIKKDFFADLNWSQRHQVYCQAFPGRFEAWIMYPRTGSSNPNAAYCWNWLYNAWSTRILFNDTHNCFIEADSYFGSRKTLMGITGDIVELFNGNTDDGTAVSANFRTKKHDWSDLAREFATVDKTSMRIEMDYSGTAPTVQVGICNNLFDAPTYETGATMTDTATGLPKADSRNTGRYLTLKVEENTSGTPCKIARYKLYASKRGRT